MPVRQWLPDQFTEVCQTYGLVGMVNKVGVITNGLTHQDGRDRTGFCWALQTQGRRALVDHRLRQPEPDSGDGPTKAADAGEEGKRPCYDRDRELEDYVTEAEAANIDTKWAYARDKWNESHPTNRLESGRSGRDIVRAGVEKIRKERELNENS